MKCKEMLAALGDYVDGELSPELCEEFQEHLADCNPCEVVIDNLRQTITVYKAGQPVELPERLQLKLRDMLRAKFEAEICERSG